MHSRLIAKAHEHLGSHVCERRLVIDKEDARIAARDGGGFRRLNRWHNARDAREIHGKCRPLPWRTGDGDSAAVIGNNAIDHGEPHACPLSHLFGREKRFKDTLYHLRWHAMPGITDHETYVWSRGE